MTKKKVLAVIPSRLGSTRLHAKPLKDIAGKTLVQRVWDSAQAAKLVDVVKVATDAIEIKNEVERFGGEVVMTSETLTCGSQRVFQAACYLSGTTDVDPEAAISTLECDWSMIINIQGDMPFISGEVIDKTIEFFRNNQERFSLVTIAIPICSEEEFLSPNFVKVVVSSRGEGLYFSRAPIPFDRDKTGKEMWPAIDGKRVYGFQHVGLYLYSPKTLACFALRQESVLESIEKLEQLRVIERGEHIGVMIVDPRYKDSFAEVNIEEDLIQASKIAQKK